MTGRIIFLRTCTRPIPRVLRFMEISRKFGLQPEFWGAYRDKELGREEIYEGEQVFRKGDYFPLVSGTQGVKYFKGVYFYCKSVVSELIKIKSEVKIIHVSDAEPFLGALISRIFIRAKLIYNIHDNLSQRYNFPKVINFLLNQLEGLFVILSTISVVPEDFRRKALPFWCRWNVKIAKNSPMSAKYNQNRELTPESSVNIFYAGWLDEGRCIKQLLELSEKESWIKVIIAGDGDPYLHDLINKKTCELENVKYVGYIGNSEAIKLTHDADFIFANYKANRVINVFAASNKIAEALCVGRPVIINQEIEISKKIKKYQCGIVEEYGDVQGIIDKLQAYRNDGELYNKECKNARKLYEIEYSWEKVQKDIEVVIQCCL